MMAILQKRFPLKKLEILKLNFRFLLFPGIELTITAYITAWRHVQIGHVFMIIYHCTVFRRGNKRSLWCHRSSGILSDLIGKTPVRIILWCPTSNMLIKACFLIQPLEQEGWYQKCCIYLCSKMFINHFYQTKASPECLNILIYRSKY